MYSTGYCTDYRLYVVVVVVVKLTLLLLFITVPGYSTHFVGTVPGTAVSYQYHITVSSVPNCAVCTYPGPGTVLHSAVVQ